MSMLLLYTLLLSTRLNMLVLATAPTTTTTTTITNSDNSLRKSDTIHDAGDGAGGGSSDISSIITGLTIANTINNLADSKQQQQHNHQQPSATSSSALTLASFSNSRALLPFSDSNRLMMPQMQKIKARFNQGCVGGTKCQFFAFCWMSGGSLGASCGLLMTCCVTPSRHEIQPGFYGPVVNDQCK